MFDILAKEIIHKARNFKCQEIANILWAFATVNIINNEVFKILAKEIKYKARHFNCQDIANILWAFAKCSILLILRVFDIV